MKARKIAAAVLVTAVAAVVIFKVTSGKDFYYAGTVEATEIDMSSRLTSIIADFPAAEGARVAKGDLLVRLSCEDVKIEAGNAEREYRRALKLKNNLSINEEIFEKFRFRRDNAALRLSWCKVRSPIDGTVLDTYHEPGEMVRPGTKLLTLADLSRVWAYVYVPQPMLSKIGLGMEVDAIVPESPSMAIKGRISKINDKAEFTPKNVQTREERTRLVYGVKIEFENGEGALKPGMTVEVKLPE